MIERVARAIGRPLSDMYDGCFRPDHHEQGGDCAEGDCYCINVQRLCALAAIAEIEALK